MGLFIKKTGAELKETSKDLQKNIDKIDGKIQKTMEVLLDSKGLVKREEKRQMDLAEQLTALEAEKYQAIGVKSVIDSMLQEVS